MSDAQTAWEALYVNPDAVAFTRAEVRAAFLAGFTAGQVQALTDAADAAHKQRLAGQGLSTMWFEVRDWLSARATQIQSDQT